MKRISLLGVLFSSFVLAVVGIAPAAHAASTGPHARAGQAPSGNGNGVGKHSAPSLLIDHHGPVLSSSTIYPIWWGPASAFPSDAQQGLGALLAGFNGSSYLGIAQQYMRSASISTSVGQSATDGSQPPLHAPSVNSIANEVGREYSTLDPNGIYIVFTSNYPKVNYCAWHDDATVRGVTIEVAYVPNAAIPGCDPGTNLGANNYSIGTRAMADSTAHEFMESITDPVPATGWVDKNGLEMADKCEFDYQSVVTLHNGSTWQIQSEWSNALAACQQQ